MDCRMLVAISLVVEMSFSYQGYANICGPEVKEERGVDAINTLFLHFPYTNV